MKKKYPVIEPFKRDGLLYLPKGARSTIELSDEDAKELSAAKLISAEPHNPPQQRSAATDDSGSPDGVVDDEDDGGSLPSSDSEPAADEPADEPAVEPEPAKPAPAKAPRKAKAAK